MKAIQCPQDGVYEEELEVDGGDDDDGGDNDDIGDDDHTYHPLTIADRLDQLTKQLIGKGVATFATFYNICKIFHIKDTKFCERVATFPTSYNICKIFCIKGS